MPLLARDWYDQNPDLTSFYQGDIIRDVPVVFLPDKISKWMLLRPNLKGKQHVDDVLGGQICKWFEAHPEGQLQDRWQFGDREEFVAAKAQLSTVAILTQTCDIERRNYYQIAPVRPETQQAKLEQLRSNELNYAFYLPAVAPYIEQNSYIELAHTGLMPKAYFPRNAVRERLAARLTEVARTLLQEQLKHFFSRPFGFGVRDDVQVAAEYVCVTCFYIAGQAVRRNLETGTKFPTCEQCGEARWIRPQRPEADEQAD
jgi:hypothetical protein